MLVTDFTPGSCRHDSRSTQCKVDCRKSRNKPAATLDEDQQPGPERTAAFSVAEGTAAMSLTCQQSCEQIDQGVGFSVFLNPVLNCIKYCNLISSNTDAGGSWSQAIKWPGQIQKRPAQGTSAWNAFKLLCSGQDAGQEAHLSANKVTALSFLVPVKNAADERGDESGSSVSACCCLHQNAHFSMRLGQR